MGSGGFTALGDRSSSPTWRSARCSPSRRPVYERVGGHGRSDVRASLTEDIAIGRAVGRTALFSDRRDATFRMYPRGFAQAFAGWSRTMAAGVAATRWWLLVGVAAWITSLAGGPFAGWLAYPLSAVQVWVLGRRAGRVGPLLAALYPVLVVVLVVVVGRAGWLRVRGTTTWKGRVGARGVISARRGGSCRRWRRPPCGRGRRRRRRAGSGGRSPAAARRT